MKNGIWSAVWSDCNKDHMVSDINKAEAKNLAKALMNNFCRNAFMSAHCKEFYIQRRGEVILQKAGDMIFLRGQYMNPCLYSIDDIIAQM